MVCTYRLNLEFIKERRIELGMSQIQMAKHLGLPNDKYSRRENGQYKFKCEELPALNTALNIPMEHLFVCCLRK